MLTTKAHFATPMQSVNTEHAQYKTVLTSLAATLIIGSGIAIAFFSLYLVIILRWQGPFRDLWEFVPFIEQQFLGNWSGEYLFDAYGGAHRIFLPKLFFFADFYWLHGENLLTTSTALICQIIYLLIIAHVLRQEKNLATSEKCLLAGIFLMALFSTTQVSNFLYAMDVQWYMSNALGLASMLALIQASTARQLSLVLIFGITAALCNFTGLMALPVAALAMLSARHQHQTRWPAWLLIIVSCWLYMHHSKNAQHVVINALSHADDWQMRAYIVQNTLLGMCSYTLRYLTSPLSRDLPTAGSVLSAISLCILFFYWLKLWRQKPQENTLSHWQILCLYIATYILISAIATAFGRLIYVNSSVTERYQTLVLPYLPAIIGLLWQDIRKTRFSAAAPVCITGLIMWHLVPAQIKSAYDMGTLSNRVNLAHTAARAGVLEPTYINGTLSYPLIKNNINSVKDNDTFLRTHQLGYFQQLPQYRLGTDVHTVKTLPVCDSNVQMTRNKDTSTLLLDGQLTYQQQTLTDMVLVQDDHVAGLGTVLRPENNLLPLGMQPADSSHFRAFARTEKFNANAEFIILGVRDDQAICQKTYAAQPAT